MAQGIQVGFGRGPKTLFASPGYVNTAGVANLRAGVRNLRMKWNPGHGMLSFNINGSPMSVGGNGKNATELSVLNQYGVNVNRYTAQYSWNFLEGATLGDYSNMDCVDADALATFAIGKRFAILIRTQNYEKTDSSNYLNPWIYNVPAYILADPTYGVYGPNGSQYGYALCENKGGNTIATMSYPLSIASRHVMAVSMRYLALFQALSQRIVPTCTVGGITYSGYTYDTHPLIEYVGDWDEYSIGYGAPIIPSDYTQSGEVAAWSAFYSGLAATFPHTLVTGYNSYGNSRSPNNIADVNSLLAASYAAKTFAYSNSDTYGNWLVYSYGVTGQQLFAGNSYTTNQQSSLTAGGGIDHRGIMPSIATVQGFDYGSGTMAQIYANAIGNIKAAGSTVGSGLYATHIDWDYSDISATGNYWQNSVYPFISDPAHPTIQTVPSNIAGLV